MAGHFAPYCHIQLFGKTSGAALAHFFTLTALD